eukprot:Nitzschia sp. Nitz4//scaffold1_size375055//189455//189685//NITZ4_000275-RA/size375055-processed-gene-0.136-mRNA-1//-1//CDS//3329541042//8488//frame0
MTSRYPGNNNHYSSTSKPRTASEFQEDAQQLMQSMSDRLGTGLNAAALEAIVDLLRAGVHPDAVVAVVTTLSQSSH